MENLTEEQRQIAKLEIMLDVCRRDKDALRYQLEEVKRKAAEQSGHPTGGTCPHISIDFKYICARCFELVPAISG